MKITVVGTGYVGLVTGTCFAETGNDVTCIDIDESKVARLRKGQVPIYEPGLEEMCQRNIKADRLKFTTNLEQGLEGAKVVFMALPTPPNGEGAADLSFILKAADDIGPLLKDYVVIVDKSTVPVGTAERVKRHIARHSKAEFDVVSNPEFLREGSAVNDFMNPDRTVLGVNSDRAKKLLDQLYRPFVSPSSPIIYMDERSAEITKYAANTFIAMKISFINEVANMCEKLGANVDSVREGIGADDRIGKRYLMPGIGYGGSCFPKDVKAFAHMAHENDYDFKIIEAVAAVNARQKQRLVNKVNAYFKGKLDGKKIAIWGLAFKPETDDIREAPSLEIIKGLIEQGATLGVYDPEAMDNVKNQLGSSKVLTFGKDQYDVLDSADALLVVTEWDIFRSADLSKVKKLLKSPVIFDGRNIYDPKTMKDAGFYYESIGR